MADELTETTTRGWGSRIVESIKGVLVGLALFVAAFPLLWWNEGRARATALSLEEGAGAVISVAADTVDPANEGELVHLSGEATTDDLLEDPVFGVSENAIRLRRDVEMFQWKEIRESEKRQKMGGGEETVTTYRYRKEWSPSAIDSSSFKQPDGHANPETMPYGSLAKQADDVTLGAFRLSTSLVVGIDRTERLALGELPASLEASARLHDGGVYLGADPARPAVGDTRVSFQVALPAVVSVIAAQAGDGLAPYATKAGRTIEILSYGTVPAAQMFAAEMQKNTVLTWVLRGVGFLLMAMGLGMVFRPLVVVADVVPIVGDILGMGLGLFSGAIAGALSLLTIAAAWIAVRPLVGVPLLVGGLALLIVPKVLARRRATSPVGG